MAYSRKNSKKGNRKMRNSFRNKNKNSNKSNRNSNRRRGGCSMCKRKPRKLKLFQGGDCTTEMPDLNGPIYERNTSMLPYRN